jgi:translocation and assembly module TamB
MATTAAPQKRQGLARVLRWAAGTVGVLVAAGVAGVTGLWWWAGQDGSLATAWRLAARWAPDMQALQLRDVTGALRGDGRIGLVVWEQDGLRVEAHEVTLAWQPYGLLAGTVQLDRLGAQRVGVADSRAPSTTQATPPVSLALPIGVAVGTLSVGQLQWQGRPAFEARELRATYRFDGLRHRVGIDNVTVAQGSYKGQASVGARGAMQLDAEIAGVLGTTVPGANTPTTLTVEARINGPLTELEIDANAVASTPASSAAKSQDTPRATLKARVTPWAPQPVQHAQATFRELDLAAFWPGAPQTRLSGDGHVRPDPAHPDSWTLATTLDNDLPGPIDQNRVPVERLEGHGEWRNGVGLVRQLDARLAGGRLTASGEWTDATRLAWKLRAQARGIQPQRVHGAMAALPLDAEANANGAGSSTNFDVKLATATLAGPLKAGDAATANARALRLREARAQGRWADGLLTLETLLVRADDARIDAALRVRPAAPSVEGRAAITAPGARIDASGSADPAAGNGQLDADVANAAQLVAWLSRIPALGDAIRGIDGGVDIRGQANLGLRWQGGWRDPAVQARLSAPSLDLRMGEGAAWELRAAEFGANGKLADATLSLRGRLARGTQRMTLQAVAQGGLTGFTSAVGTPWDPGTWTRLPWQLRVGELAASLEEPALGAGTWRVTLRGPVALRGQDRTSFEAGAGEATLAAPTSSTPPAVIAWQPVRWRAGELTTAGRVTGLPMAWLELIAGQQMAGLGLTGNLVFDGSWDAVLADSLRLKASLARSSGDVTVRAEDGAGSATRVAAGVRTARVDVENEGEQLRVALHWDSERAGTAQGRLGTRLARQPADPQTANAGGWTWPSDAPLSGHLRAQLPRIGVWSVLAPPGWRLRGSLGADIAIAGTRTAPSLQGSLQADDLALRSVVDGIEFGNGRLRAQLEGTRIRITEFLLEGAGDKGAGGQLVAQGEAGWIDGKAQARLQAQVRKLRASIRTDRQLTVSGDIVAELAGRDARLTGKLLVDQANILLPDESKPALGSDVVVRSGTAVASGEKAPERTAPETATPKEGGKLAMDVRIDLGRDFRIQGRGIDTRVAGELELTGSSLASPLLNGSVRTIGGQYRAYGQRLDVERGVVRFAGTPDNPTLDILALRANMLSDQKVGVQITGTALLPRVRLYASPDMSDAEKLSWLVLGRSSASGGAEAALLQQAALALLGSRNGAMSGGLASALGLDELSVRGSSTSESGQTVEGAVTLGKRFSRNFYAAYERSLSGALGTLYVFYDLSRRFTLRAQTGETSAVDLIYTLSYD